MILVLKTLALTRELLPSDRPVWNTGELCIEATYSGIAYEDDGPPRIEFGQLINCVIQTSGLSGPGVPGDIDGTPWIGFAEPVNSVVGTPRPDALGVRSNGYSPDRIESCPVS